MEEILIRNGGFRITFTNGYGIDVINGYGSYSENHFNTELAEKRFISIFNSTETKSKDCEIAITYENELVNPFNWDDTVKGFVSVDELVEYINKVKKLDEEISKGEE